MGKGLSVSGGMGFITAAEEHDTEGLRISQPSPQAVGCRALLQRGKRWDRLQPQDFCKR